MRRSQEGADMLKGRLARHLWSRIGRPPASSVAFWAILGLAVLSVTIRPVVAFLRVPQVLLNTDALVTPAVAAVVFFATLRAWRELGRVHRVVTVGTSLLFVSVVASWSTADHRSWASLALGGSVLLVLPLMLYMAAMATGHRHAVTARRALAAMVLAQLGVGLVQYVILGVAQVAPGGADLVDGTTSHNFWPVFALPASLTLAITTRDRSRFLWPIAVTLLAVYAEAKAALVVWVPVIVVVLGWAVWRERGSRSFRLPSPLTVDAVTRTGVIVALLAGTGIGLFWTPSVQGTWEVFVGHSRTLEEFARTGDSGDATQPTLRDALGVLSREMSRSPKNQLLGLGPANTVSHSAEVLARGARGGGRLPPPGPVAKELLSGNDVIKFRDAQSSVLGIGGDLGGVGAALYVVVTGACVLILVRATGKSARNVPRNLALIAVPAGILAGGLLLDWPEQASIILPLGLSLVVLATPPSAGDPQVAPPDRPADG